jgi:hypothetical protein
VARAGLNVGLEQTLTREMNVFELLLGGLIGAVFGIAATELWHWIRPPKDEVILEDLLILLRKNSQVLSADLEESLEELQSLAVQKAHLRHDINTKAMFLVGISIFVVIFFAFPIVVNWGEDGWTSMLSLGSLDFQSLLHLVAICIAPFILFKMVRTKVKKLQTLNRKTLELKRAVNQAVSARSSREI